MDDLIDMIISDESPSQVSERIKDILFAKSAERVDAARPYVAASLFGEDANESYEDEDEDDDYDDNDEYEVEDEDEDEED
jgi:hypothetical protein